MTVVSINDRVIEMLKKHGLLKKINHATNYITIRKSWEFTEEETKLIHASKYFLKAE